MLGTTRLGSSARVRSIRSMSSNRREQKLSTPTTTRSLVWRTTTPATAATTVVASPSQGERLVATATEAVTATNVQAVNTRPMNGPSIGITARALNNIGA